MKTRTPFSRPSRQANNIMQRTALRAAADAKGAERSARQGAGEARPPAVAPPRPGAFVADYFTRVPPSEGWQGRRKPNASAAVQPHTQGGAAEWTLGGGKAPRYGAGVKKPSLGACEKLVR